MADAPTRDQNKYVVRFPEGMRDRIAAAAKASNRSMNAEIVARLEASFATDTLVTTNFDALMDLVINRSIAKTLEGLAAADPEEQARILKLHGPLNLPPKPE